MGISVGKAKAGDTLTLKMWCTCCIVHGIPYVSMTDCDLGDTPGFVTLGEHEYEVTLPHDWNPIAIEVAELNNKIEETTEQFHQTIAQLKGRVNDLQCLGMSPAQPYKPEEELHVIDHLIDDVKFNDDIPF